MHTPRPFSCLFLLITLIHSISQVKAADNTSSGNAADSLWERKTLTNDWFGAGSSLREHGIQFNGSLTQFYQGLTVGTGREHQGKYGGKLDSFIHIDAEKLGLWKGLGIHSHTEFNYGQSPVAEGGTFLPNNIALMFPAANGEYVDLSLYLTQQLGNVSLMFGKINTIDLYDMGREFSGGRGIEKFQHVEFTAPLSGITPPMIFGGIVSVKTDPAKYTLMIYDPANQTRMTGFEKPFGQGVTFNGSVELKSNFFDQSGKHIFTGAYSTQKGTDFSDIPQLLLPNAPPPAKLSNRWYFAYAFEQTLWRDATDPKQAWGLFGQVAISDGNPNPVGWSALGGIAGTSPIPSRELDKFGVGAFSMGYSNELKNSLRLAIPAQDELGVEIFYNLAVMPWMRVTFDAQFIDPPRSDRDTVIITGLRTQILF